MQEEILKAIGDINDELSRPFPSKSNTNKAFENFFRFESDSVEISSIKNLYKAIPEKYNDDWIGGKYETTWRKEGNGKLINIWLNFLERYLSNELRKKDDETSSLKTQLKQLQAKDYENRIKILQEEKKELEESLSETKKEITILSKNEEMLSNVRIRVKKLIPELVKGMTGLEVKTTNQPNIDEKTIYRLNILKEKLLEYDQKTKEKEKSLQTSLQELQKVNQDLKNQLKDLSANDEETQKLKKDLENLTLAFGLTSNQLSETQTKLNQLELQSEQNQIKLKSYEEEIQNIIKLKTSLENDNQRYEKTNQELKTQLAQNKDKISSLEGERNFLNNNLNRLSGELEITLPETETEKKSIQEKIEFFINYFKQVQTQKEELEEKFQQEAQASQELRQSLNELEEKLNQSDNSNLQNIQKITNENRDIRKKIKDLELELVKEKQEVSLLNGQLSAEEESLKKAGVKIQIIQKENQTYKNKLRNWQKWTLWGGIIGGLILIGVLIYKKLRG